MVPAEHLFVYSHPKGATKEHAGLEQQQFERATDLFAQLACEVHTQPQCFAAALERRERRILLYRYSWDSALPGRAVHFWVTATAEAQQYGERFCVLTRTTQICHHRVVLFVCTV
jgi:hypothetical protein